MSFLASDKLKPPAFKSADKSGEEEVNLAIFLEKIGYSAIDSRSIVAVCLQLSCVVASWMKLSPALLPSKVKKRKLLVYAAILAFLPSQKCVDIERAG